jgi:hypothetical protein
MTKKKKQLDMGQANDIPTVVFDPDDPWEPMPQRPFIMKCAGSTYRYGNRYNICTESRTEKTIIVDLHRINHNIPPDEIVDVLARDQYYEAHCDITIKGKKEIVVLNEKEYDVTDILLTGEDIFPEGTFKDGKK